MILICKETKQRNFTKTQFLKLAWQSTVFQIWTSKVESKDQVLSHTPSPLKVTLDVKAKYSKKYLKNKHLKVSECKNLFKYSNIKLWPNQYFNLTEYRAV